MKPIIPFLSLYDKSRFRPILFSLLEVVETDYFAHPLFFFVNLLVLPPAGGERLPRCVPARTTLLKIFCTLFLQVHSVSFPLNRHCKRYPILYSELLSGAQLSPRVGFTGPRPLGFPFRVPDDFFFPMFVC